MREAVRGFVLLSLFCVAGASAFALSETTDPLVPETDGTVYAVLQHQGKIYVGGTFREIGGVEQRGLAAFDAITGEIDPAWNPQVGGSVAALATHGDKLYVGGLFTGVNDPVVVRNSIAAFELANGSNTGVVDPMWDPGMPLPGHATVYALELYQDRLYVGGYFYLVNSTVPRDGLAAFELANGSNTGQTDLAWNPAVANDPPSMLTVRALEVGGGRLYVGGEVNHAIGPGSAPFLQAFELANGSNAGLEDDLWRPELGVGLYEGTYFSVEALLAHNGVLYVGGSISSVNTVTRDKIAALNLATGGVAAQLDPNWDPNLGGGQGRTGGGAPLPGAVMDFVLMDSTLCAVGRFETANGPLPRKGFVELQLAGQGSTGAAVPDWSPDIDIDTDTRLEMVRCAIGSGSGIIAGGDFAEVEGAPRANLVGFGSTVVGATLDAENWIDY